MTGQIAIQSSPVALSRKRPLLAGTLTPGETPTPPGSRGNPSPNVGEVAGGTAAECAVVWCCCPCVLLECLILAVYKVPATVCRRMLTKRRQKMIMKKNKKKKGVSQPSVAAEAGVAASGSRPSGGYCDELSDVEWKEFETVKVSIDGSPEAVELDKQMWDQFHNTGFWRSPSQRHT